MVWSLFKPRKGSGDSDVALKPMSRIDRLTYAIGDIHGRYDLFVTLLSAIRSDAAALQQKPTIVLLGDYIDRGPDSAKVLSAIIELTRANWCDTEVLLGNHELFMIKFALDINDGPPWLNFGGIPTLASYGIAAPGNRSEPKDWQNLQEELLAKIPRQHLQLLSHAKIYYISGDYLFVHGGVQPGVPIEEQTVDTMLWIRDAFLSSPKASDYVVVHGHSAKATADNLPWRIGIDTGAYATGILSAIRLYRTDRKILQVRTTGLIDAGAAQAS